MPDVLLITWISDAVTVYSFSIVSYSLDRTSLTNFLENYLIRRRFSSSSSLTDGCPGNYICTPPRLCNKLYFGRCFTPHFQNPVNREIALWKSRSQTLKFMVLIYRPRSTTYWRAALAKFSTLANIFITINYTMKYIYRAIITSKRKHQ